MAGRVSFDINLMIKGGEAIEELAERLNDLRPAFEVIVQKWAKENRSKFESAAGMEASGATIDPTVFWEKLAPSTMKQKRKRGQADNIMVATGDLKQALSDPDRFFHESTPTETAFGTPMSVEDELKVRYNWEKRQVIFLGADDERMIEETIQSYLSLGPNFQNIRFAQGVSNLKDRNDSARMSMEFSDAMGE